MDSVTPSSADLSADPHADAPPVATRHARGYGKLLLRVAISGGLIALLAWQLDWRVIAETLGQAHAGWWCAAWLAYLASQASSVVRWTWLAQSVGYTASLGRMFAFYFHGMFFSLCLPSSIGGDVYKAYRLGGTNGRHALAFCTVLADRLTGLLALLVLGAAALLLRATNLSGYWLPAVSAGFFVIAFGGCALACACGPYLAHVARRWPKLHRLLEQLSPYYERPWVLSRAVAYSMAVQGLNVLSVICLGRALGIDVPAVGYFIAVPAVALLSVLPLTINGIGIREGGLTLLLAPYGLTQAQGLSLGLLWFSVLLASGAVGGLIYLGDRRTSSHPSTADAGPPVGIAPAASGHERTAGWHVTPSSPAREDVHA